ncbi:MAG: hypothetical protein Q8O40_02205, partial [Chloroflexota bacterium]|nr:hypothetical protein [Chloroflexota bacterium]
MVGLPCPSRFKCASHAYISLGRTTSGSLGLGGATVVPLGAGVVGFAGSGGRWYAGIRGLCAHRHAHPQLLHHHLHALP